MSELTPKTYEIVLNAKESTNSACDTFVYEPENVEEEKLGYLYVLGQVIGDEDSRKKGSALLSLLASHTSKNFFKKTEFEPKEALEKTLAETNRIFEKELKSGKLSWAKRLNIAIILLTPQAGRLCFAFRSDSQGLLWRKGNLVDITHQVAPNQSSESEGKLFSTIASGNIILEDKIIFSSPALKKKIPAKDLKSALEQTRYSGIENIKEILALNEDDDLALLVLDLQSSNKKPQKPILQSSVIKEPLKQEPQTRAALPKQVPDKKKHRILFFTALFSTSLILIKKSVGLLKKYLPKVFIWFKNTLKRLRLPRKKDLTNIWSKIKNFRIKKPSINLNPRKIPKRYYVTAIFIVLLVLVPFALISLVLPSRKATKDIIELPEGQELLLDVSKQTLSSNALGVFYRNNHLMVFDESSIYVYSLKHEKGDFIFPELTPGNKLAYQTETESQLVYLSSDGEVVLPDKDLFSVDVKVASGLESENILDIDSFFENIYVLTASGKIIKYSDLDFSTTSTWMNVSEDFGINYLSLAIDGSVYILEKSGLIHKYDSGEMDREYLITTKGLAEEGDRIFTDVDFKNLYLMSRSQGKIIIFDKESQLPIKTIENPTWTDLKHIYILIDESELYILDGFRVYRANI